MTTDTQPTTDAPMTVGELGSLTDALKVELEKFSKTTLVLYLATHVTSRAWAYPGTRASVSKAQSALIAELKIWADTGRMVNRTKRIRALIKQHDEDMEAISNGRPLPKKKRKLRAPKRKAGEF